MADAESQLSAGRAELEEEAAQLEEGFAELEAGEAELNQATEEIERQREELLTQQANIASLSEVLAVPVEFIPETEIDRKSTPLNSSHVAISYAVFCLKKKKR